MTEKETKLRKLRLERCYSHEKLAKMLDPPTSAQQIVKLEARKRKLTYQWATRLAEALGVSKYDVLEDSDVIVSAREREMLDQLRSLPLATRKVIMETIRVTAEGKDNPDETDHEEGG